VIAGHPALPTSMAPLQELEENGSVPVFPETSIAVIYDVALLDFGCISEVTLICTLIRICKSYSRWPVTTSRA
jgi:hypothetical protein